MPAINYRKLRKDEINLIINNRIAFLYELQGEPTPEKETALRKNLAAYFTKALNDNSFIGIIAEQGDRVIGSGGMVIQEIPGHFKIPTGKLGYILNIFTIAEFRALGIASAIVDMLVEEARRLNLDKVYLHASAAGIEIYRKKGFVEPDMPEL
ncbi:MAG: GNAT family N-acetyltransferase, partial [Bacteroidales bacterium]|nr:GNAT family N-acetyltransferase [Bacteroidales bacterium]